MDIIVAFNLIYSMIQRGKFIVLEGLDRSGKSSLAKYIRELISQQHRAEKGMNFPDRDTPIGKMINDFLTQKTELSNQAIHLLFSANRWEKDRIIRETLEAGTHIVCDRYWYSGVAYSAAKGLDFEWCMAPDRGLVEPDLVIFLSGSPEVLSKRASYGEEIFQKVSFQKQVKLSFERLFSQNSKVKTVEVDKLTLQEVKQLVRPIILQQIR